MAVNRHAHEFDDLIKEYKLLKRRIIQQCAIKALSFFKASFVNQGFTDQSLVKWKNRIPGTPNDKGRGNLMGSGAGAGTLKRGLRIMQTTDDSATISVDKAIPYAEIQNFGGQIPITPQMRRFFWAMYFKAGGGKVKGNSKHAQTANDTAQFYMNLAITKEKYITIPARQFIGYSATLERQLKEYITNELDKFFKII